MKEIYNIPEKPVYDPEIRKLKDTDPASASQTFNPLFEKMIENTASVKVQMEESVAELREAVVELEEAGGGMEESKGQPGGLATLDEDGKIPSDQLLPMDYDKAGAAVAVQSELNGHKVDTALHVTAEKQSKWDTAATTADAAKSTAANAQVTADQAKTVAEEIKEITTALRKPPEVVEIKTSGTYTVPDGVYSIDVYLVSSGGPAQNGETGTMSTTRGGYGGAGGKIVYMPNYPVIPNQAIRVIIGAAMEPVAYPGYVGITQNWNDSYFGNLYTGGLSMVGQTDKTNVSVSITAGHLIGPNICPINGKVYGLAGAAGGNRIFPGDDLMIKNSNLGIDISKSGGLQYTSTDYNAGGGGASPENGGKNANYDRDNKIITGGNGGNASVNTGNGGGGGGAAMMIYSATGTRIGGTGGKSGSGIIVLRLHYS